MRSRKETGLDLELVDIEEMDCEKIDCEEADCEGAICEMVGPERFELPTHRFVACCSIQLSYEPTMWDCGVF